MVEGRAADDLAGLGIDRGERKQSPDLGQRGELLYRRDQSGPVERGQVPGFAKLRVGERGQDGVGVVERRKAEDDAPGAEAFRRGREAQLRHAGARERYIAGTYSAADGVSAACRVTADISSGCCRRRPAALPGRRSTHPLAEPEVVPVRHSDNGQPAAGHVDDAGLGIAVRDLGRAGSASEPSDVSASGVAPRR